MKQIGLIVLGTMMAALALRALPAAAADEDGVAIAIVFDTSGSMKETVPDESGTPAPKFRIADRALVAIANRIQAFATNTAAGPRKINTGLFVFQNDKPRQALPFGPFDAEALTRWARGFSSPAGGTPLGNALATAGRETLRSGLTRKHVLVITDGLNTVGPDPAATLPGLQREASQKGTVVSVHFVAFDVDAKSFDKVKKLGATVVGAANATQLNEQLGFILEKKILLEEEEPPQKK